LVPDPGLRGRGRPRPRPAATPGARPHPRRPAPALGGRRRRAPLPAAPVRCGALTSPPGWAPPSALRCAIASPRAGGRIPPAR